MCGTYYVDDETLNEIERVIREVDNKILVEHYRKDIHPTDIAPVIISASDGITMTCQRWGFPGFDNNGVIFNARSETVTVKNMFRRSIRRSRAVIPARHFYEWNGHREKNVFSRADGKPLMLAGFHDRFDGGERFVILTTAANDSMLKVHDRMPLILETNQVETWLNDDSMTDTILKQIPELLDRSSEYEQQNIFDSQFV